MKGPLWYSGPGTSWTASRGMYGTAGTSGSTCAGVPDRISFGRPVLPPDVGAFHDDAHRSGSGAPSKSLASKPAGTVGRPAHSTPTSSGGSASSTSPASSADG